MKCLIHFCKVVIPVYRLIIQNFRIIKLSNIHFRMELLTTLMNELNNKLSEKDKTESAENIIFEHIKYAENNSDSIDDFPIGLDWFNVSKPLTHELLKGKIVVLDFFTYCCINCLHIIPILQKLEDKFTIQDGVVVIGVHSAKFENEKNSNNILQALKKYQISHPVINDKNSTLWNKYEIYCWPTIVVLSPNKKMIFALVGDEHKNELMFYITCALKYFSNSILSHELPIFQSHQISSTKLLKFPSKITRWEKQFAVSDCGNNRILIFNEKGIIKFIIGGKDKGFKDGKFSEALFNSPQGLIFYDAKTLYIADTNNHAIRLANLEDCTVATVVGNGQRGKDFIGGKLGVAQDISSPWDLCIVPCTDIDVIPFEEKVTSNAPLIVNKNNDVSSGFPPPPPPLPIQKTPKLLKSPENNIINTNQINAVLLIAAAGTHQIWAYFIKSGIWWKKKKVNQYTCLAIAGSGKEENRNNVFPNLAAFAQPSGLIYSKQLNAVFVADSESSSIRKISLSDGSVTHVIGGSRFPEDLFSFGDHDGKGYNVRLQHPLGITWNSQQNCLFVCDTYNHKIKKVDIITGFCSSLHKDANLFNEPGGCCMSEDENLIFVCDTNNNEIKTIDLSIKNLVKKFELTLESEENIKKSLKDEDSLWEVECSLNDGRSNLTLKIEFSPSEIHGRWKIENINEAIKPCLFEGNLDSNIWKLDVEFLPSKNDNSFKVIFDVMLCGSEICSFKKIILNLLIGRKPDYECVKAISLSKNLLK